MGVPKHPYRLRSSAVFHISFVLNCNLSTVKHALQNTLNDCYQSLSNSSKVHQIRFRPWLRPRPRWGSLQRSQTPSMVKGPTSKGGGKGEEGEKVGRERGNGRGMDEREKGGKREKGGRS